MLRRENLKVPDGSGPGFGDIGQAHLTTGHDWWRATALDRTSENP